MRKFFFKNLLVCSIITTGLLSSCSKQITSMSRMDKLVPKSSIIENKSEQNKNLTCNPSGAVTSQTVNNKNIIPRTLLPKETADNLKLRAHKFIHGVPIKIADEFKSQVSLIRTIGASNHVASYNHSKQTQGMLGIAALCLIGAIALAVFGLAGSITIFYYIAGTLFIAAIVFFLLYFVAKTVGPDTK